MAKYCRKRFMDNSLELEFEHKKNYACMAWELREIAKRLQWLTMLIMFLRNDCEIDNLRIPPCMHLAVSFTAWWFL